MTSRRDKAIISVLAITLMLVTLGLVFSLNALQEAQRERDDAVDRLNKTNQCINQFFNAIYQIEWTVSTKPPNETQFERQLINIYGNFTYCLGKP